MALYRGYLLIFGLFNLKVTVLSQNIVNTVGTMDPRQLLATNRFNPATGSLPVPPANPTSFLGTRRNPVFPQVTLPWVQPNLNHNNNIRNAITQAYNILQTRRSRFMQQQDPTQAGRATQPRRKSYLWHHARVTNGPNYAMARNMNNDVEMIFLSQDLFNQNYAFPAGRTIAFNPGLLQQWRAHIAPYCRYKPAPIHCNPFDRYRTADGSCNNLRYPNWGAAMQPHRRFLPPAYADGMNTPRVSSVTGMSLPSARQISNAVHSCGMCPEQGRHTILVMTFGQFRDHDITHTPTANDEVEQLDCCAPENSLNGNCFPIAIPLGDPRFGNKGCMSFSRSLAAPKPNCDPGVREQINQITSYLDASSIYGSSIQHQQQLRLGTNGLLKFSAQNRLPVAPATDCMLSAVPGEHCFDAGDGRRHEVPTLTCIHMMFLREHNRYATDLRNLNPHWNDERLFQETRKIVAAVLQHITYNEYLPIIIGRRHMDAFALTPRPHGHYNVYNPNVDATSSNAFAAAAFRFGHSMIPDFISMMRGDYVRDATIPIQNMFNRPVLLFEPQGDSRMVRALINDIKSRQDGTLVGGIRDMLFLDEDHNSLDLAALNIQRGRDHGVPSYNHWRRWCGYPPAIHFGAGPGGLSHHDPQTAARIASIYSHPEDIDLFTGGLTEIAVSDGLVGPVFACIIAKQFKNLKEGDRFWYENNIPLTGFTAAQVNEIKKSSFASILCLNANLQAVQALPFYNPSPRNPRRPCQTIPKIDLNHWKEIPPPGAPFIHNPLLPPPLGLPHGHLPPVDIPIDPLLPVSVPHSPLILLLEK